MHADVKCATIRRGYAGVVELVDSMDLGSIANRRAGSSPAARTIKNAFHFCEMYFFIASIMDLNP